MKSPFRSLFFLVCASTLWISMRPYAFAAFTINCSSVTQIPVVECNTLQQIYTVTNGDTWVNNTNWGQNLTPGNWNGITLSGGHVAELALSSNNLVGNLEDVGSLSGLSRLTSLNLHGNILSGPLPENFFSGLTLLTSLNISKNMLAGVLPPNVFSHLTNLKTLILYENYFSGPLPNIQTLPLTTLHVYVNNFNFTDLAPLKDLTIPNLQYAPQNFYILEHTGNMLDAKNAGSVTGGIATYYWSIHTNTGVVYSTTITGSSTFPATISGTYIALVRNSLLPSLVIQNQPFVYIPPFSETPFAPLFCENVTAIPFSECKLLEKLYTITNGSGWTDNTNWGKYTDVSQWYGLGIDGSHVTQIMLAGNNLAGNISASGMSFSGFPQLSFLSLVNNSLSGVIAPSLFAGTSKLESLYIQGNSFSGTFPFLSLSGNTRLATLMIQNNHFSGQIPPNAFSGLVSLNSLNISNNAFTGSLPSGIFDSLTALSVLILSDNSFSGPLPSFAHNPIGFLLTYNNAFNFHDLESIRNFTFENNIYAPQAPFSLIQSGNTLDAKNAGILSGGTNTYTWYDDANNLMGTFDDVTLFPPPLSGTYYVLVDNTLFPRLTLRSLNYDFIYDPGDITGPSITLKGANPLYITRGQTFTDPGASWTDDTDGSGDTFTGSYGTLGSFTRSGSVNSSTPGRYIIEYEKIDRAGNRDSVIREVFVTDTTDTIPPVVTLSGANPFTLERGTVFDDPGASWTDDTDGSGNTFVGVYGGTGSFARSGTLNSSVVGTYVVQYRKVDLAGNSGTVSRTVSVVTLSDTIPPVVMLSGNASMSVVVGNVFTDPGASWTDNRDGSGATLTGSYGATGSFARSGSVNMGVVGTYVVQYRKVDLAGNSGTVSRTVSVVAAPPSGGGSSGGGSSGGGSSGGGSSGGSTLSSTTSGSTLTGTNTSTYTGVIPPGYTPIPDLAYPDVTLFSRTKPYCSGTLLHNLDDTRLDIYYKKFGIEKGSYTPLTRAEFLRIVLDFVEADIALEKSLSGTRYYPDVSPRAWYRSYVNYATRHGIVSGNNGYFSPNARVTRAEATKILIHALGEDGRPYENSFIDVPKTHTLARFIQSAFEKCFLSGKNTRDGKVIGNAQGRIFDPEGGITGPETLKILYNMK